MKPTTIQNTGKGIKLISLASTITVIIGIIVLINGGGYTTLICGFFGWSFANFLKWWNHD